MKKIETINKSQIRFSKISPIQIRWSNFWSAHNRMKDVQYTTTTYEQLGETDLQNRLQYIKVLNFLQF